ncbi:MAG: hypothetical protein J6C37_07980 [Roseburia sp.]|nr:hypothetical protein [Roseburia sp.]
MQCPNCGTPYADDMTNCPNCGAPATAHTYEGQPYPQKQAIPGQPYPQNQTMQGQPYPQEEAFQQEAPYQQAPSYQQAPPFQQAPMTKKEFRRHPSIKKNFANIRASAIILYVCGAISLLVGFASGNSLVIIDVALIVGLALGIHLIQSRACAILVTIYAALNMIISIVSLGSFSGWLILVASIFAAVATFQFQKTWKNYQQTGMLPPA